MCIERVQKDLKSKETQNKGFKVFRRTHAQYTPVLVPCSEKQRRQGDTRPGHTPVLGPCSEEQRRQGDTRPGHTPVPKPCSARRNEGTHAHTPVPVACSAREKKKGKGHTRPHIRPCNGTVWPGRKDTPNTRPCASRAQRKGIKQRHTHAHTHARVVAVLRRKEREQSDTHAQHTPVCLGRAPLKRR